MLLLVFLLWQITQKQHQYVDIYIYKLSSCKKNRKIYLPGTQDSRLQISLTRGNHQPHPVANFNYKTSM